MGEEGPLASEHPPAAEQRRHRAQRQHCVCGVRDVWCVAWCGVCVCVCGVRVRVRGQHRQAAVNTTDLLLLSSLKEQS